MIGIVKSKTPYIIVGATIFTAVAFAAITHKSSNEVEEKMHQVNVYHGYINELQEEFSDISFKRLEKIEGTYVTNPENRSTYNDSRIFKETQVKRTLSSVCAPFVSEAVKSKLSYFSQKEDKDQIYKLDNAQDLQLEERYAIQNIGHATQLIQLPGFNILTDPIFNNLSRLLYPEKTESHPSIEELPKVDVVIISHNHRDHVDRTISEQRQTVARLEAANAQMSEEFEKQLEEVRREHDSAIAAMKQENKNLADKLSESINKSKEEREKLQKETEKLQKETESLQKLLEEEVEKQKKTGKTNQALINTLQQSIKDLMKQAEENDKRYKEERENSKVEQENLKKLIEETAKAKEEAERRHQEERDQREQEAKRAEERHQKEMSQMKQDKEDFKKELMEGQKELIQELMRRFQENQEKKTERSESRSASHSSQASNEQSDELNTGPSSDIDEPVLSNHVSINLSK